MKMRQYNRDISRSAKAFLKHVEPLIRRKWSVGYIHPCEGKETGLDGQLDHEYGIDYRLIKKGRLRGLSSRVLFRIESLYQITFRKERIGEDNQVEPSEYWKHKKAIEEGSIYPEYFCCACVVDDKLLSAVAVKTAALIRYIDETNPPLLKNYDPDKKQTQLYWAVDWRDMERHGVKVWKLKVPTI